MLSLQVKTGPFFEHSNTLWSISAVSDWTKVNSGLLKMYKAEVKMMTSFRIISFISINIIKHYSIHEYYIINYSSVLDQISTHVLDRAIKLI